MVGKHEYMNMGPRIYRVCYATEIEHMKQKELFFQYYRFSACVDANYDIKESIKDNQTVQ